MTSERVRLSPVGRLDAEEAYRDAASKAIQARHPHAAWLVQKRAQDLTDVALVEATRRLQAWLDTEVQGVDPR